MVAFGWRDKMRKKYWIPVFERALNLDILSPEVGREMTGKVSQVTGKIHPVTGQTLQSAIKVDGRLTASESESGSRPS